MLDEILRHGGEPASIAREKGYERLESGALGEVVATLIDEHPDEWSRFRDGDEKLAQFFIGQVMKADEGSGERQRGDRRTPGAALRAILRRRSRRYKSK